MKTISIRPLCKISTICSLILTVFLAGFSGNLEAKDLGKEGYTFTVDEEDLKTLLQKKAAHFSEKDFEEKTKQLREKLEKGEGVLTPVQVEEANVYRSFLYDPSLSLQEEILDAYGKTLFEKGTTVNPLDHVSVESALLFFDGTNPKHVAWAERQKANALWILTNGNPIKLKEEKKRDVYFDQGGVYTRKLQIKKIPCRISQKEKHLFIEEMPATP